MATLVQIGSGTIATMVTRYGERLAEAMREAKASVQDVADATGISYQAVKKVLDGRSKMFNAENSDAAAKFLKVNPSWLASGADPRYLHSPGLAPLDAEAVSAARLPAPEGTVSIPQLDVTASMGGGVSLPSHEDVVTVLQVNEHALRAQLGNTPVTSLRNLRLISAYGDSMAPTFASGDILLVDAGVNEVRFDAVYVMSYRQELFIKRLQRRPSGVLRMLSDNKNYDPIDIDNGERDEFAVLARVLIAWNARKL